MEDKSIVYLILDIETVPDGRLIQKIKYPDRSSISPQEAVEQYKGELLEKSGGGSDFIPYVFQLPIALAMVAVYRDFRKIEIHTLDRGRHRPHIIARQFWKIWNQCGHPTLISFNGRSFDLPILELAAFRYGIDIGSWFQTEEINYKQPRYRYNFNYHWDLMELLTNFGTTRFHGGLNLISTLLGKPGKMNIDGSLVEKLWREGEKEKIDDYCLCDVLDTYFTFLRILVITGKLSLDQEKEIVEKSYQKIESKRETYAALHKYLENFTFWQGPGEDESGFMEPD